MHTTLDHTLYPHIFDRILSTCPRSALLTLRCTSHAVCAAVDAQLAYHIVVVIPLDLRDPPSPAHTSDQGAFYAPLVIYTPAGRLPVYRSFWGQDTAELLLYTSDGLPMNITTSTKHARVAAALRATRVLDCADSGLGPWLAPLFPNLVTLRASQSPLVPALPAPTLVCRASVSKMSCNGPPVPLPGTRKLVLHIYTDTESWRSMLQAPKALPPMCEFVIIFHARGERKRKLRTAPPPRPGILGELARRMAHDAWRPVPRHYTLVDAHTVDPAAFGFGEKELEREEMEAMLLEALRRPQKHPRLYDEQRYDFDADRHEAIRFMGLEEYALEAGPGELEEQVQGRYWATQEEQIDGFVLKWRE